MSGILLSSVGNSYGIKPVNVTLPTISGTVTVGSTLSSTTGTWTGTPTPTYTYQWQRNTSNISGATNSTYTIVSADVGNTLRCVVTATNVAGATSATSASTSVVPAPWTSGQTEYTTAGTYTFIPVSPAVSVVCVGGGGGGWSAPASGGGGGGGLGYKNNYPVTIGASYTVVVGINGVAVPSNPGRSATDSYFDSPLVVMGGRGQNGGSTYGGRAGGTYVGDGGGNGGNGGGQGGSGCGGGGGAGGYSGDGGAGGGGTTPPQYLPYSGAAGTGGAGGGGGMGGTSDHAGGGGGVGLLGQGPNGAGGAGIYPNGNGSPGGGGSGGGGGATSPISPTADIGGNYGGGGGGTDTSNRSGYGAVGAVRVIWGAPGVPRAFPNTNTGNL